MQPRILVKEQGQNKKRFISPTEVKNNKAIYGDPIGGSKISSYGQSFATSSDRMYSPDNRRSIVELQRQVSQKQIQTNFQISQKQSETQRMRSIGQNTRVQPKIEQAKSTSKSKPTPTITKKDYMMSSLAKLNRHKPRQSDEESNGSQSRSKLSSIKVDKPRKSGADDEYAKNVYNQKQKEVRRRPRNTDNQSQASSVGSEEGFGLQKNGKNDGVYGKGYALYSETNHHVQTNISSNPPTSPTVRPKMNQTKNIPSSISQQPIPKPPSQQLMTKRSSKEQNPSFQQAPLLSPRQQPSYSQQFHEQKLSFTPSYQTRTIEQPQRSQIQDSNNSSLVVHLKKAHEEKEELVQKKIQAERQRNQLKQRLQRQQQQMNQLKSDLQHLQVQNLSLNSELKSIKQTQTKTKTEMLDTNQRNQHVYRELHQKYQHLTEQYRKMVLENDSLRQENQRLRTENINLDKKVKFLENRSRQLDILMEQKESDHMKQLKQTVEEWKGNLERVEKELRKYQTEGDSASNGSNLGQLKIKLIECETELAHKMNLLKTRDEQVKFVKKQATTKLQQLEQMLFKKDKEIKDLNQEIAKQQKLYTDKSLEYDTQIKQLHLKLAKTEKDLNLKRIQLQQSLKKSKSTQDISQLYTSQHLTKQGQQAKHSLQLMVSQQTSSMNQYKKQLNKLIADNFSIKSQLQQQKSHNNNLQQELNILQMQYSALEKKQSQSKDTEIYLMKSQLQTALRKQKELQQKLQSKTKEVKEKDSFIQSQLIRANK